MTNWTSKLGAESLIPAQLLTTFLLLFVHLTAQEIFRLKLPLKLSF